MNSYLGLGTLKSTTCYIGIRAQMRNPINRKLPIMKKASRRRIRREIWVAYASFLFSFLFFSFLFFFLIFFYFRRFRADYFLVFLLSFYFLDLDVIV